MSDLTQAILFHSKERRLSLAGIPDLFRSTALPIPTSPFSAARYPDPNGPVTFKTVIRITGATPAGLVFEIGDVTTAMALWIDDSLIKVRAGDALAADRALASFDNTVSLPIGLELDIVASVRPGDGRIRLWLNGRERARDTAVNGQLPNGTASSSDGAFAAAAVGALPSDVTQTGAPTSFDVVEPLSMYYGQVPRHFV